MKNFKERLGSEYRELTERIGRLQAFMNRPKSKETVGEEQYALLGEQKEAMEKYRDVLEKRLVALGEDIDDVLSRREGVLDRDKVLAKAVDDCLSEMYRKAQPSDSYTSLCTEFENGTLELDEKRVYDYFYLSEDEYVYIKDKYKDAYNIRERWSEYVNLIIDNLKHGGLKNGYEKDSNGMSHRTAEKTPPIEEVIGKEPAEKVFEAIEDIRDFYRFDREESAFDFTIGLGSASPTTNKDTVINSWKKLGIDVDIVDRDPLKFWDIDEYGPESEEDDEGETDE